MRGDRIVVGGEGEAKGEAKVEIGLREVYDMVVLVKGSVDSLHARLDAAERTAESRYLESSQRHADHEKRLRYVERWAYSIPPTILLALASLAVALLTGR